MRTVIELIGGLRILASDAEGDGVQDIAEDRRPHSPDPSFWEVWTGEQDRAIDWREIARTWQGAVPMEATE